MTDRLQPTPPQTATGQEAEAQDQELLSQARDHIAQEFGGQPPDVQLSVEDKRIRLTGKVRDADTGQRIAKAAAIGPGVLGVNNDLEFEVAPEPTPSLPGVPPGGDMPKEAERGVPLPPPEGVIHHKV